nr:uncharacterized protein LOC117681830 [Crassostrea gigas]
MVEELAESHWLRGPLLLRSPHSKDEVLTFPLVSSEEDKDVRPEMNVKKTEICTPFVARFEHFSTWKRRKHVLKERKPVPPSSSIVTLNPFMDKQGIVRVGGRLSQSNLPVDEKNPVIIPGKSHVSRLLVSHFHSKVYHQGRFISEGNSEEHQRMSDSPVDRLTPGPPFSAIGVDVFRPWTVAASKTRGGLSHSKRWAVLFTCLTSRSILIEVMEEMSASSFINALRRFVSIRGPVKEIRSDRGTNFLGALDAIQADAVYTEKGPVRDYLCNNRITWILIHPMRHTEEDHGRG